MDCFGLQNIKSRTSHALALQRGDAYAHHLAQVLVCKRGRICQSDVQGIKNTWPFRERLVQKCYRADSATGRSDSAGWVGLAGECCCLHGPPAQKVS